MLLLLSPKESRIDLAVVIAGSNNVAMYLNMHSLPRPPRRQTGGGLSKPIKQRDYTKAPRKVPRLVVLYSPADFRGRTYTHANVNTLYVMYKFPSPSTWRQRSVLTEMSTNRPSACTRSVSRFPSKTVCVKIGHQGLRSWWSS